MTIHFAWHSKNHEKGHYIGFDQRTRKMTFVKNPNEIAYFNSPIEGERVLNQFLREAECHRDSEDYQRLFFSNSIEDFEKIEILIP